MHDIRTHLLNILSSLADAVEDCFEQEPTARHVVEIARTTVEIADSSPPSVEIVVCAEAMRELDYLRRHSSGQDLTEIIGVMSQVISALAAVGARV